MNAPIIIPTLCRYEHFKNCVESLAKNKGASDTDLYIALDYPLNENHWKGYNKINEYLDVGIIGFNSVTIIKRKYNFGAEKNFTELKKQVLSKYDRIIVTEDDNVFSKDFLDYINGALEKYKDNMDVVAVCGYSYPIKWKESKQKLVKNRYMFSAWGYGTWKNRMEEWDNCINSEYLQAIINDKVRKKRIKEMFYRNYSYLIGLIGNDITIPTDITISIYMCDNMKYTIMPTETKVLNQGWDDSGMHCSSDDADIYHNQKLGSQEIDISAELQEISDYDLKALKSVYNISIRVKFKTIILNVCINVLGCSRYRKIKNKIKRFLSSMKNK